MAILLVLSATADADVAGLGVADPDAGAQGPALAPPAAKPRLPSTAFPVERQPRGPRTKAWTKPQRGFAPSWERKYPDARFSRFLNLARPDFHPPKIPRRTPSEWRGALFRFAIDVAQDLREAIATACPPGPCAPALEEASQRMAAFAGASSRGFDFVDRGNTGDPTNNWYGWSLTAGGTSIELGCHDRKGAPEVACKLELTLSNGRVLSYRPDASATGPEPDIAIRENGDANSPVRGEIRFARTFGGSPVVILAGEAIAGTPAR